MKRNIYTCKTLFPLRAIPPDEFSLPESHLTTRLKIIENTFRVRSDLKKALILFHHFINVTVVMRWKQENIDFVMFVTKL
jgi:hypothetical protein